MTTTQNPESLKFDLTADPLGLAALAQVRAGASALHARQQRLTFALVAFALTLGLAAGAAAGMSLCADPILADIVPAPEMRVVAAAAVGVAIFGVVEAVCLLLALALSARLRRRRYLGHRPAALLKLLEQLNPDAHTSECVEFIVICQTHPTVRAFQHKLVTIGRLPLRGEYLAAKEMARAYGVQESRAGLVQPIC